MVSLHSKDDDDDDDFNDDDDDDSLHVYTKRIFEPSKAPNDFQTTNITGMLNMAH